MSESWNTRIMRWKFNLFPAFRGSGARITYIAPDLREVRLKLPLNWRTRNYVGTIFGGSMYAAVDPIYMVMLINLLGSGFVVWDKAAVITFKKPGRGTLYATFRLPANEVAAIEAALDGQRSIDRVYDVDLTDGSGTIHATIQKTIYVRRKDAARSATPVAAPR